MTQVRWDHPVYHPEMWCTDIPKVGRYLIKREQKGSRLYTLSLNNKATKYRGTCDELKIIVQRIVASSAL